jgi:hypothetical protein
MARSIALLSLVAVFALSACGGDVTEPAEPSSPPPVTETEPAATEPQSPPATETLPEPEPEPAETITLSAYFLRGEKIGVAHREVGETEAVGRAGMEELLAGPDEETPDLGTEIPVGTRLLGLTIEDGVATVDLSAEFDDGGGSLTMFARLAQVVYTLTQFPTVEGVLFRLDGEPVETFSSEGIVLDGPQTREDYEDVTPLILVETPAPGDAVSSPLRLGGISNVFEATLNYELLDADGQTLAEGFATATCGTGCWGDYDVQIEFGTDSTEGTLLVFELSAKDGSRVNLTEIPLQFE